MSPQQVHLSGDGCIDTGCRRYSTNCDKICLKCSVYTKCAHAGGIYELIPAPIHSRCPTTPTTPRRQLTDGCENPTIDGFEATASYRMSDEETDEVTSDPPGDTHSSRPPLYIYTCALPGSYEVELHIAGATADKSDSWHATYWKLQELDEVWRTFGLSVYIEAYTRNVICSAGV